MLCVATSSTVREFRCHTLARDVPDDELPETVQDGVFVARIRTGYGRYHGPESYKPPVADEVVITREEVEETVVNRLDLEAVRRAPLYPFRYYQAALFSLEFEGVNWRIWPNSTTKASISS